MKDRYAYYPGCLASLSQKELDSSSRAIMGLLGAELVEMPSVTCCGAGDIHEAKPDYYLHISARILGQAERSGCDTILTICNVCTLNLRQANERLKENPAELARINDNLKQTGIGGYEGGVDGRHLLGGGSQGAGGNWSATVLPSGRGVGRPATCNAAWGSRRIQATRDR